MSQSIDIKQTLVYLNEKFNGAYTFEVKKDYLVINAYKNGKKYRDDSIFIFQADTAGVYYSDEEKAIIIKCLKEKSGCVDRRLYDISVAKGLGVKNSYKRSNLLYENKDEKSIEGIQRALVHLFKLVQDSKYESAVPFEK